MTAESELEAESNSTTEGDDVLRFGGDPVAPPPEVFAEARRGQPVWFRMLEGAYKQLAQRPDNAGYFADPEGKGATVVQIARVFELFGTRPFCVLARVLPAAQTEGIERLAHRTPRQLLDALRHLAAEDGELNVPSLHHDGKTGHCIRLTNHDAASDFFEYHDPWPGRSLLCEENNRRGVRAERAGTRWKVRAEELERVLVGSFVLPPYWWRAEGEDAFALTDTEFRSSEFASHFHLNYLGPEAAEPLVRCGYAPGQFGKWLQIVTDVRPNGRISAARLIADRKWVGENMLLGLDLTKSFVLAFTPQGPNEGVFQEVAAALWSLVREPQAAARFREADPGESDVVACVHAFAGSRERATVSSELGSLTIGTFQQGGRPQLGLEVTLH